MEVSFVNAGILTLERSVGLTFGANIGTTITSQLVSLKLRQWHHLLYLLVQPY